MGNRSSPMAKSTTKPLVAALGAAFLATSVVPMASADVNPFAATQLSSGYDLANYGKGEGKCGEGKCGGKKGKEGKCGEGKCGEGKCGEGKKGKEGKCGEGKCGGKKGKEGKCGEGKCGSM